MYIHIGNRKTVSGHQCLGIFNMETLRASDINNRLTAGRSVEDRTLALLDNGEIITSNVSSVTVIKRTAEEPDDYIWRRNNDENVQC